MLETLSPQTRLIALLAAMPLLLIVLLFEVAPFVAVAFNSLHAGGAWSVANYAELISSGFQRNAFVNSLVLSLATAAIAVCIALPIAVTLRRMPARIQNLILTYANIGANFTGFPIAFAFIIMFGLSGSFTLLLVKWGIVKELNIYSTGGLMLVYSYFQIPLALLLLFPGLGAITPDVEEAAHQMGASRLTFWRRIGLPLLAPALISCFVMLFANAMGTYATAFALVGGNANLITIRIGELVAGDVYSDPNLSDALAMILVMAIALPVLVEQLFVKGMQHGR